MADLCTGIYTKSLAKQNSNYSALEDCGSKKTTYSSIFAASSNTSSNNSSSGGTPWLERLATASQVVGFGASCVALGNAGKNLCSSVSGGETDSAEIAALKAEIQTNKTQISTLGSSKATQDSTASACDSENDAQYKQTVATAETAYTSNLNTAELTKTSTISKADGAIEALNAQLSKEGISETEKASIQAQIKTQEEIKEKAQKDYDETKTKLDDTKAQSIAAAKTQMEQKGTEAKRQSEQYAKQIEQLENKNKANEAKIKAAEKKSDKDK